MSFSKFKASSRSSLWRHAKSELMSICTSSSESDGNDLTDINLAVAVDVETFDEDVGGCDCDTNDISMYVDELPCSEVYDDSYIGRRWLNTESDEEPDSSEDDDTSTNIENQLAKWAAVEDIKSTSVNKLLKILSPHFPTLPLDWRTLSKTPVQHNVIEIGGGQYCHVGLEKGLLHIIQTTSFSGDSLELQINVDGIPLFHSSSTSLWPILCLVRNVNAREPFVVGLFCGKQKPTNAAEFLSQFVSDTDNLMRHGFTVDGKKYAIKIHSFVCDAPARAFVKGTKCHSGYSSCEKCIVHGEYMGKVIFPTVNDLLRTDEDFELMKDENHHVVPCPLSPLRVGLVSQFGLDYMHMACLGVMRRLLLYWKGPVGPLCVRLARKSVIDISKHIAVFASHSPVEFARKARSVDEVLKWKATEFRQLLLYSGPFVLAGVLSDALYRHFMLLFVGLRILSCKHLSSLYCDYANELLVKFVKDGEVLYGKDILVYNVHSFVHLAADVKKLGCIQEFSAFPFENKLGRLKKLVHKPQHPIQQVLRRLDMQMAFCSVSTSLSAPVVKYEHSHGPLVEGFMHAEQYERVQTDKFSLALFDGNNCIMTSGCVPAKVKNIVTKDNVIYLLCNTFTNVSDAFDYPLLSSALNIFRVDSVVSDLIAVKLDDVICKCVCFPAMSSKNCSVVIPLLH